MVFHARPADLTADDIQRLVEEETPEGDQFELKATLPSRRGNDPWVDGENGIGDFARNKILEEVVAFANAHGGWLVVGVEESDDHPKRASDINPIRECQALAERLRLQCRDCIEPQLPLLDVAGVSTNEDGSGVVVFHVPQSRLAPHRHQQTRECYIRRADRTEKMTMREIQDLTLQTERGMKAVQTTLEARQAAFDDLFRSFIEQEERAFGLRLTGVPTAPISIERVHRQDASKPALRRFTGTIRDTEYELFVPFDDGFWRPLVRGSVKLDSDEFAHSLREVFDDGRFEYQVIKRPSHGHEPVIYLAWYMGLVANSLSAIERLRAAAGAPNLEYALEIEVVVANHPVYVGRYGRSPFGDDLGPIEIGRTIFPTYSVGPPEEFQILAQLIERDFLDLASLGSDVDQLVIRFD